MAETDSIAVTNPTDIEKAIEAFLVARFAEFKAARRQQNNRYIFTDPAATVAIFDGKIEKAGQRSFRINCPVHVQISLTNAKGEEARRDECNPLIFGVIRLLARKRFGLRITDLIPAGFKDVTSDEDWKNNKIVYDLEFTTSFNIECVDDEVATDLLTFAVGYFLQPDDGAPDASDLFSNEGQPPFPIEGTVKDEADSPVIDSDDTSIQY